MAKPIPFKSKTATSEPANPDPANPDPNADPVAQLVETLQAEVVTPLVQRIDAVEAKLAERQAPSAEPRPEPEAPKLPTNDDFYTDPMNAVEKMVTNVFDRMFAERGQPVAETARDLALAQYEANVRSDPDFEFVKEEYEAEKQRYLDDPNGAGFLTRRLPDGTTGIDNLFYRVIGANRAKIAERRSEKEANEPIPATEPRRPRAPFTEPTRGRQTPRAQASDRLTDEEKAVAEKFGMSAEEYAKVRDNPDSVLEDLDASA